VNADIELYAPGRLPAPGTLRGGDLLFVRSGRPWSYPIRALTRGPFSHVAVCVDAEGTVVEAVAEGVVRRDLAVWKDVLFAHYSSPNLADAQRAQVVRHAERLWADGWGYDWATLFGMGVFWGSGGRVMVSSGAKTSICSGLAADCYHSAGVYFPERIPHFETPNSLWRKAQRGEL
jgi:hypothetical protein